MNNKDFPVGSLVTVRDYQHHVDLWNNKGNRAGEAKFGTVMIVMSHNVIPCTYSLDFVNVLTSDGISAWVFCEYIKRVKS